ncbi:uncharacterized protein LOC110018039 [Phalaenopsis equestris]|uniref:uncharacterized protein LOC110018039 n=1 Tax=Phalaenopsis equestris TaxID=78828 RepID=UPI0009E5EF2F|nr:uncharacterized protein LOC110018039 [Phalaenopsis equestris]XP_020571017.1 uncharacterized protein LOC110018039 [Phalaenopsis equestris]
MRKELNFDKIRIGLSMDYIDSSELKLLEISRGVRKLTQMIESWSKAPNLDSPSKSIAKDILRDSLALHESLVTVRRLQKTSRMMSFMEQKREFCFANEKEVEEEGNAIEQCGLVRFGVGIYDDIIHSLFTNGSSRNHFYEKKSSISDKFNKQEVPSQAVQSIKKDQKSDKNFYEQSVDYENLTIKSCFTDYARRTHENGSEAPNIVIMKPLEPENEKKGENHKKKEKIPADLALKKEIFGDRDNTKRRKVVKRMNKASGTHKHLRKESVAVDSNKVIILNSKSPQERKEVKVNKVLFFQTKRIQEPPAKPEKKLAAAKGGARAVCIKSKKTVSTTDVKTMMKNSATYLIDDKKKWEKISGRSKNIKNCNTKCKGDSGRTEPNNKVSVFRRNLSTPSIHGFPQQLAEGSKIGYGVIPKDIKGGKHRLSINHNQTPALKKTTGTQEDIKLLLLTSPDFLTEAEALFGFDVRKHHAKSSQNRIFEPFGAKNPHKLLIDCAMEFMARKIYQLGLLNHPICRNYIQNSKFLTSLEQLVEDISNGVKEMNDYYRTESEDDFYLRLERDLRCKNVSLNASWDFGWICSVCGEDFGAVVEEMGDEIICGMVGEVAFDLVH